MAAADSCSAALPPRQWNALRLLSPIALREGFYLAGGTALALRLGHRRSIDLDWFTEAPIPDPEALASSISSAGIALEVCDTGPGTLHARLDTVALSFLSYRYPLIRPLFSFTEIPCTAASLEDIACMKLAAVTQRTTRKDFVDVFALGKSGIPLAQMLELFQQKYGLRDMGHVLVALTYFDEADREPMPAMLWNDDWTTVKETIRAWVKELAG